ADVRGYAGGIRPGSSHAAHGPGCAAVFNAGSGYGGVGGTGCYNYVASAGGPVYGNSNYPVAPGSGARAGNGPGVFNGTFGGGSVQIRASDTCTVHGRITANALGGYADYAPGASGGGIYIRCKTFIGSSNGLLQANGGGSGYGPVFPGGPGGGGRIAVWRINDLSESAISTAADPGARYGITGGVGTIVWGRLPSAGTIVSFH
ncbi:MAG: hypothetical protein GX608_12360, partial [Lentisphaerae bacterium]|nr:hypothetical protein [Lentisphaerota bacterium]